MGSYRCREKISPIKSPYQSLTCLSIWSTSIKTFIISIFIHVLVVFILFLQISAKMFYGKLRSYWFYKVLQNKLFIMIFMGISMNLLWFGINLVDITTIFAWKSWKRDFDRSIYWGKSLSNWLISPQCCILYRNQLIVSLSKMNGWFLFGIQN